MTCYAYFGKDGEKSETMEEHIEKGLKVIDFYIKRKYHKKLAKCLNINNKVGEIILKTSYVFHDIGKGLTYYQKSKTFRGHEFYSAYIAYNSINTITGDEEKDEKIKRIISCAIALHHHTMVNRHYLNVNYSKLCKDCINIIEKYSPIDVDIPKIIKGNIIYSVSEYFSNNNFREIYLILVPLMVADNISAILNRNTDKENLGVLGREVMEIYNIYKKFIGDDYALHNNLRI